MKTAMQQAIDRLVDLSNATYFNGKKSDCDIIDRIQLILKNEYLPKEREQIESAYDADGRFKTSKNNGVTYYETTFKK